MHNDIVMILTLLPLLAKSALARPPRRKRAELLRTAWNAYGCAARLHDTSITHRWTKRYFHGRVAPVIDEYWRRNGTMPTVETILIWFGTASDPKRTLGTSAREEQRAMPE